jgi:4-amino-4-deoxy-L-arabinose transferase-like glycosyltransferase
MLALIRRLASLPTILWILALSVVAVGYQFFLPGLSGDSPLYASVARGMLASGDFFGMRSGLPEFRSFAEHPHLGFWVSALFFRIFGVADWSYRIAGQLFYFGSLVVVWRIVARAYGGERAVFAVLMLWLWPRYAQFFANAYLDAGFIFFALCAYDLWAARGKNSALLTGFALGAALLYKGTVGLALGPIFLFAVLESRRWRETPGLIAGMLVPLVAYLGSLELSGNGDFVGQYLSSVSRRGSALSLDRFFALRTYTSLVGDTLGLVVAVPVAALIAGRATVRLFPFAWVWVAVFFVGYAATGRVGFQYWTTLMPAIAMGLAAMIPDGAWLRRSSQLRGASFLLALALIPLTQAWPRSLRGAPGAFAEHLVALNRESPRDLLFMDRGRPLIEDFSSTGALLWYSGIGEARYVQPGEARPVPSQSSVYVLARGDDSDERLDIRKRALSVMGWCEDFSSENSNLSLWLSCAR